MFSVERFIFLQKFNGGEITMPSNKILEAKQATVAALAEKLKTAASGVLVQYQGITVEGTPSRHDRFGYQPG